MATIRELLVSIGVNADSRALTRFDSSLNQVKGSASSLIGVVGMLGAALGGLTLGSLIKDSVQLAADFENVEMSFATMLKDANLAKQTLAELRTFSEKTPFRFTEVQELSKQLLAAQFQAKELIPIMGMVGDISSGIGKEKLPQVVRALTQIKVKGRLMGQELLQLTEAGVPIIDQLAKNLKVDKKLISEPAKLGITYKNVEDALRSMTQKGGMFYDMMAQQSKTWSGKMSEAGDIFDAFKTSFGQGFIQVLMPSVNDFTKYLQNNKETLKVTFENWGKSFGEFVKFFTEHTEIIKAALVGVGVVAVATAAVMAKAFIGMVISGGPIMWIITAIGLLIAAIVYLGYEFVKNWDVIKSAAGEAVDWISQKFKIVTTFWTDLFTSFFNWIASGFQKVFSFIDPIISKVAGFFGKDINFSAMRTIAPAPAASPVATAAQNYNSSADNRQYNINVNANSVKNPEKFGYDFATGLLEGVE